MSEYFGFRPVKSLAGGECRSNTYALLSSSQQVFKGDLMILDASGKVARATSSATSTGPFLGAALENGPTTGTTADTIKVCDDPNAIYEAVSSSAVAATAYNLNYNAYVVDGSSTLKKSLSRIGASLAASVATGVKVIGVVPRADNTAATAGQELLCVINSHSFKGGTAGI